MLIGDPILESLMVRIRKASILLLISFFALLPILYSFHEARASESNKLSITLLFDDIGSTATGLEKPLLVLRMKATVEYSGADPPKTVLLSLPLESRDPTYIMTRCLELTQTLGPWVSIGPGLWRLNLTAQQPIPLPDYSFSFEDNGLWPNERSNVTVFAAFSPRTISGNENSVAAFLGTVNPDPSEHYCYYLACNQLSTVDTILYQGGTPTSDDPHGCFFSLVLSHEYTPAAAFSYLPIMLNLVYPILAVFFLVVAIASAFARFEQGSKIGMGSVVTSTTALIVLLFTFRSWIVSYVPPWIVSVYAQMNSLTMWMFALLVTIVVLTIIARTVGIGIAKWIQQKRQGEAEC